MRSQSYPRFLRTVTIWIVLFAQVHLLLIVVLHRHETFSWPKGAPASQRASLCVLWCRALLQAPATSDNTPLCAACQIVRLSAVRPAVGIVADTPMDSAILANQNLLRCLTSFPPGALYGRAPPLV